MDELTSGQDGALLHSLFRAHPWHGVALGTEAPEKLTAFIEIVPTDTVKYEIDKVSGHLKVDRPRLFSSLCPTLYGFIPQTFCAESVGALAAERSEREQISGDGDPMDICVLSEKTFGHGDFLVRAIPIGGLRMIDSDLADDKIIAVMERDALYGELRDVADAPVKVIERLRHYFLTYKDVPGEERRRVEITYVYDREEAYEVIRRSSADYLSHFGRVHALFARTQAG